MRRREFIALLSGGAAWPLPAGAQQRERMRRIGVLTVYPQTDREGQVRIAAFLDALQRLGWTDDHNLPIEYRWGADDRSRERAAAAELVRLAPDVIVVAGSTALPEMQRVTSTIPIVFTQVTDPVAGGFVADLARPGGNTTGFETHETAMGGKWLGLLKEAVPSMRRVAVRFGSDVVISVKFLRSAQAVAPSLNVDVTPVDIRGGIEIERVIATFAS